MTDKIKFMEGEIVAVDLPNVTIYGNIVGLASEHIIDMWIVRSCTSDREKLEQQGYNFSCFVAPSPLIRKL